jgi:phage-related protein
MDLFDLVAKITLDSSEYENELKRTDGGISSFSSGWAKAGKVAVAAIGAATVAIGALTKTVVQSYAEYEQLAGGVKKLYGDAADELMSYANEAYKTSGMSANQYMEQATSFSAALIKSLGGDTSAAAKQTDVAMRAISDNYNTFGGDIERIQNAFQGFARGNFMMLDNLSLGYSGTKQGMQDLIADANEYAKSIGMAGDLSIDSFSDIVTAIDLVQQKQGIAGTTAKEAATTIEGSLNMTKAAWENLVAGFANPDADLGQLMDNLVVAIVGEGEGEGLLNQIIPAIQRAMEGIGQLLEQAAPILAEQLPSLIDTMLPPLISAALSLVTGLVSALPSILQVLVEQMPMIVTTLVQALTEALPMLAEVAPQLILTLATGIGESLPTLIPAMIEALITMVTALLENAPLLVDAAVQLITGLAEGLIGAIPILIEKAPIIIASLVSAVISAGVQLISAGVSIMNDLQSGIVSGFASIPGRVIGLARQIPSAIKSGVGSLVSIGSNLIAGLWNGIKSKFDSVISRVKALASQLPKAVKKVLGISSPSKVFAELGKWIPEGLALGIEKNMRVVEDASGAMADATLFSPTEGYAEEGTGTVTSSYVFNVYATPNQSAREIAEEVRKLIIKDENQRRYAWV